MTPVIQKKSRPIDGTPYAVIIGGAFKWKVLKTYQNDDAKQYARWFLATSSPYTHGEDELGDGYVQDVVFPLTNQLVEVDGREPTAEDQQWFTTLQREIQTARSEVGESVRIL